MTRAHSIIGALFIVLMAVIFCQELENSQKCANLEAAFSSLQRLYIGEAYIRTDPPTWLKFKKSDIITQTENALAIKGGYLVPKKDIFYYEEVYDRLRKKVKADASTYNFGIFK